MSSTVLDLPHKLRFAACPAPALHLSQSALAVCGALAAIWIIAPWPLPMLRYTGDWLALLDASYRIDHGQRPHIDFGSPVGVLPLLLAWVSTHLAEAGRAFWVMQGLQWMVLAPFAAFVMAQQGQIWRKLVVVVGFSAPVLIPYVIDADVLAEPNGNGIYNRFATATVFLLFSGLASPARKNAAWVTWFVGLLLILFFTKITAFGLCLVASLLLAAPRPVWRALMWRSLALVAAALLLLQLCTGLLSAYVGDALAMARINSGRTPYFLATMALRSWAGVLGVLVLAVVWWSQIRNRLVRRGLQGLVRRPIAHARALYPLAFACVVTAAILAAESQNTGALNLFAAIVLMLPPRRRPLAESAAGKLTLVVAVVACVFPYADNVVRRGSLFVMRQANDMAADPALKDAVAGLHPPEATLQLAAEFTSIGIAPGPMKDTELLQNKTLEPAHSLAQIQTLVRAIDTARRRYLLTPDTHTTTIGLVDLATRMAGTTPSRGTWLWLDPVRTFGPMSRAAGHGYLLDVDAAFEPTCNVTPEMATIAARLRPSLEAEFEPRPLDGCWTLWRRRGR